MNSTIRGATSLNRLIHSLKTTRHCDLHIVKDLAIKGIKYTSKLFEKNEARNGQKFYLYIQLLATD